MNNHANDCNLVRYAGKQCAVYHADGKCDWHECTCKGSGDKKTRRWQNLLYKKCPNCDERLLDKRLFWECPTIKEDGRSCFFIRKLKALEYLMNPEHPANSCLSLSEREHLNELLEKTGIHV